MSIHINGTSSCCIGGCPLSSTLNGQDGITASDGKTLNDKCFKGKRQKSKRV